MNAIRSSDLDTSIISFSRPKKNESDVYVSQIYLREGSLNDGGDDDIETALHGDELPLIIESSYVTLEDIHADGSLHWRIDTDLRNKVREIDRHIVDVAFKNRMQWFGKNLSLSKIQKFYKSPLDADQNHLRCFLNKIGDTIHTTFFSVSNNGQVNQTIAASPINQGIRVRIILHLHEICMTKTAMMPRWVAQSIKYPSNLVKQSLIGDLNSRTERLLNDSLI